MLALIINPVAGNGRSRRALNTIRRELDQRQIPHQLFETQAADHATELAREAISSGADAIAVLGGDGLLSEVSRALMNTDIRLIFIPCGTGNDFVRSLSLPKNPLKALVQQLDAPTRRIDCGTINDKAFINVSGTGLDIDVLIETERSKHLLNGNMPYFVGLLRAIRLFKPFDAELIIDGASERGSYTIVSVANGKYFGGGMKVAPLADLTDGAFDVMIVKVLKKWQLWILLPLFLPGWHIHLKSIVRRVIAKDIIINPDEAFTIEIDGELEVVKSAHYKIQPNGININCEPKK